MRPYLKRFVRRLPQEAFSPEVSQLKDWLSGRLNPSDPGHALIAHNTIFFPHEASLRASPFHMDSWLRDQFVGCLALDDATTELYLLNKFLEHRSNTGHVPTTRLMGGELTGNRMWFFDDESNALALIWRAKIAKKGRRIDSYDTLPNEKEALQDVLNEIRTHVNDGMFYTGKGIEHSWFDAFDFHQKDVVTYNQGIYAAALQAAGFLGLDLEQGELRLAVERYNQLVHSSGRLQMSRNIPYVDVSSLFGEFLSQWVFGERMLDPDTLKKTYQSFNRLSRTDFMVVSKENGAPLDPKEFNESYPPGTYQNGAEWPVMSAAARFAAFGRLDRDHGFWKEKIADLQRTRNAESNNGGGEFDPRRTHHLWNAAVYAMAKQILTPEEYYDSVHASPTQFGTLNAGMVSEANQLSASSL